MRHRGFTLIELLIVITLIALMVAVAVPCFLRAQVAARQSNACTLMKALVSHEAVWRSQDFDRNGTGDYWVRDVRGLYGIRDQVGSPVALINVAFARADRAAAFSYALQVDTTQPNKGYFVQAMTTDQDGLPYVDAALPPPSAEPVSGPCSNRSRFGFTAFPEVYGQTGISVFVVGEDGIIREKDDGAGAPALDRRQVDAAGDWRLAGG